MQAAKDQGCIQSKYLVGKSSQTAICNREQNVFTDTEFGAQAELTKLGLHTMTPVKVHLAMAAMAKKETVVHELCSELGVTRQTLYRYMSPSGQMRASGKELLRASKQGQKRRLAPLLKSAEVGF